MTTRRVQISDARLELHDVMIEVDDLSETSALEAEIERAGHRAKPLTLHGHSITSVPTVGELELEHGDVIGCGHHPSPPEPIEAVPHVVVVAGPDSGHLVRLAIGRPLVVGRGSTADLSLADPLLSSHHLELDVQPNGRVVATDLGSTNGSLLENELIAEPAELVPGDHVQIGSTVLTIAQPLAEDFAVLPMAREGTRPFPRQFRSALSELPNSLKAPRAIDDDQEDRGSTWWRALLPIFTGIGFAAVTGRWIFLAIIVISPVVMAITAYKRKKVDARRAERLAAKYQAELAEFRTVARRTRKNERRRRRDAAHCGGMSALLSQARHKRLWERLPSDDDFLALAVGLAELPSAVEAIDPDDQLEPLQWGTPLQHNLIETGALAIVGSVQRGRAVTRNLLTNVAATHSPSDVHIWIIADDHNGDDWGFARWLPHTFLGDDRCSIAVTETDRAALVRSLLAQVEQRREVTDGKIPTPIHVVVIDGTELIDGSDLAELIGQGRELGIAGITIDERLVPEGAGATLRLGANADESTFESRHQPLVDNVIVTEMRPGPADGAARRMAALTPTVGVDGSGLGGTVHLVDLDPVAQMDGLALARRWASNSHLTNVLIGATKDGVMAVDLVKDGPHGLIGGTSGSGKTEFLKTLFISLCLHNHPDDLSIVVVDFKGGVDHDAIRPLPHVIDVATNLDIDQFFRTITLLKAEQTRRQDLLSKAGSSNIVAYRAARLADPSLPPMPRLLVVVDEFGELLSSPEGKEQIKELESITRIGRALGLHLLLVTQNFENSLPPQIDANAGLRVCLRVNKPSHSKIVLDSDAAALIPDNRIGRAFSRFHGRDLIEFQTARVAGRRRETGVIDQEIDVQEMPFSLLGGVRLERHFDDVPAEDTDMFSIIENIRAAASASGWRESAIPWPKSLPDHVSAVRLAAEHNGEGVAIGLADFPETQRRGLTLITERDEQVALVGGPTSPVPEVMATYAAVLAAANSADDLHLYGIDFLGRSLQALTALPHCGAVAVRNDPLALRVIRSITDIAAQRRALLSESGAANIWEHAELTGHLPPQIVVFVSGVDRALTTDSPHQQLVSPLNSLVNDCLGVRIQIVLGGLPKMVFNRLAMNIERRLVFGLADKNEYPALNVPKPMASELTVERRAFDMPAQRLTQLARLSPDGGIDSEAIRTLASTLPTATVTPPKRFADVSWPLPFASAGLDEAQPPASFLAPVPVGVELESGEWGWLDAVDDGPMLAVAGSPKSGRSSALLALATFVEHAGWSVLNVEHSRRSPLAAATNSAITHRCGLDEIEVTLETIEGRVMVLVDDLQRITDGDVLKPVIAAADRALLVVSGTPDLLSGRMGVMRSLPPVTGGLLLVPVSALDGAAIGLRRLPDEWLSAPRPGRGVVAIAGEARQIQVPLVDFT